MSDIKTINIQVEKGSTEHALLTGAKKTRRRRVTTRDVDPASISDIAIPTIPNEKIGSIDTQIIKANKPDTVAPEKALSPQAGGAMIAPEVQRVPIPAPSMSGTTVVGGSRENLVKITPKSGIVAAPKLLPKKRLNLTPAVETRKQKPKFIVSIPPTSAPPLPPISSQSMGGMLKDPVTISGRKSTRRKFKARRIQLTVSPTRTGRKLRRKMRARVAEMPIATVRALLTRKGILKQKDGAKMPPEEMMRTMLIDYMLLHQPIDSSETVLAAKRVSRT